MNGNYGNDEKQLTEMIGKLECTDNMQLTTRNPQLTTDNRQQTTDKVFLKPAVAIISGSDNLLLFHRVLLYHTAQWLSVNW
jgi:hypothetical protein